MLLLTRRLQETLMINDDISVTVLSIRGNQVVLGVSAAPAVRVDRLEIYNRKRADQGLPPLQANEARDLGVPRHTLSRSSR